MLVLAATLMALSCPASKIENYTKEWNRQDQQTFDHAKIRCAEIYPEAPCMKLFRKKDSTTYNVICGGKSERNR